MNGIYLQWNSPRYLMNDWTWISLIHTSSDLKQEKANVTAGMAMKADQEKALSWRRNRGLHWALCCTGSPAVHLHSKVSEAKYMRLHRCVAM